MLLPKRLILSIAALALLPLALKAGEKDEQASAIAPSGEKYIGTDGKFLATHGLLRSPLPSAKGEGILERFQADLTDHLDEATVRPQASSPVNHPPFLLVRTSRWCVSFDAWPPQWRT